MNTLEIPAKIASPYIKLTPKGQLEIKGKSFDDDVVSLYTILNQKIQEYGASGKDSLDVNIYLKYFNTASSKCLFDLLHEIRKLQDEKGVKVSMEWNYIEGDDDMKEEIEEFREETGLDFEISPEQNFL